jgi:hypothetical protein
MHPKRPRQIVARMRYLYRRLTAAAATVLLSACGGNYYSSPGPPCGAPQGTVIVAYPAPGSTGVPDNFPGIIFASTHALFSSYQAIVVPNGSSIGTPLAPVAMFTPPLPTPNQTPSFANPIYQMSAANGYILPAATLINVYLNDLNSNCSPRLLSSFTSQ